MREFQLEQRVRELERALAVATQGKIGFEQWPLSREIPNFDRVGWDRVEFGFQKRLSIGMSVDSNAYHVVLEAHPYKCTSWNQIWRSHYYIAQPIPFDKQHLADIGIAMHERLIREMFNTFLVEKVEELEATSEVK